MNLKGGTNVTEELRAIMGDMRPGDTLTVPPGEYLVDVNALKPKARTTFNLQGAVFRVVPNDLAHYTVIEIRTEGVTINGGYFIGDKDEHRGSTGQWGFGIKIGKGAIGTVLH